MLSEANLISLLGDSESDRIGHHCQMQEYVECNIRCLQQSGFEWNDFISCSLVCVGVVQLMSVLLFLSILSFFFCILGITELVVLLVQHHDERVFLLVVCFFFLTEVSNSVVTF